jgi:hypothetical protein
MTSHLQPAPDRLSRNASNSEQESSSTPTSRSNGLARKEDCPTGPTRKKNGLVVWSTKASRTPCAPLFNAGTEVADFHLPRTLDGTRWYLAVDTCRKALQDSFIPGEEPLLDSSEARTTQARAPAPFS